MGKIKKSSNDKEKRLLLLEQDVKVAKALAGNDKKVRERVLKNLKKWFEHRSSKIPFTQEDFLRVWKGLFYTMWMADKPLVQEECAEKIAQLIHFPNPKSSLLFFKCALIVMATEWFGIDQLRLDKFLMFVRRILRRAFEVLKRNDWELELVTEFGNILLETVLKKDNSNHLGLTMHVTEIYLEELAKVSNGELDEHLVAEFIKPFIKQLSVLADNRQVVHMRKYMFHHLLHQSDEGIEYSVRFEAWKQRGFPGGTIDSMQKVEVASDEDMSDIDEGEDEQHLERKALDPRAGQVNVDLPQLQFNAKEISQLLLEHKFVEGSISKTRKVITKLAQDFEKLSRGTFPLGIKEIRLPEHDGYSTTLKKSVNRLVKFEKKLLANSNKSRKRKIKNNKSENFEKSETDTELTGMAGMFQNKLQEFIEKSEGNLTNGASAVKKRKLSLKIPKAIKTKTIKKQSTHVVPDDCKYENHFRRNSGTWIVHRYDDLNDSNVSVRSDSFVSDVEDSNNKSSVDIKQNGDNYTPKMKSLQSRKDGTSIENSADKRIPKTNKKGQHNAPLFPQNEWDVAPKEGEVEIFVPSNKFKMKMQKIAQKTGKNVNDLLNNSINNMVKTRYSLNNESESVSNLAKKRLSLDAFLVKNPFAKNGTPKSEKRVKIDLKLNKSQDIHEHQAQLRSSPAIPFDATKRPTKPLLKSNAVSSPINPFYKKLKLL